eukprot:scaffold6963_cov110-Isochrysis_galbana.AAC.2
MSNGTPVCGATRTSTRAPLSADTQTWCSTPVASIRGADLVGRTACTLRLERRRSSSRAISRWKSCAEYGAAAACVPTRRGRDSGRAYGIRPTTPKMEKWTQACANG